MFTVTFLIVFSIVVPIDSGDWPLKPLFFEVPKTTIFKSISTKNIYDSDSFSRSAFVGRKWIFREILEHFTTDLPTSGGIIIQGSSATGKTRIIQHLVQNSCFGHIGNIYIYLRFLIINLA